MVDRTEKIIEGYNSIPIDIPIINCNQRDYEYKGKKYEFREYAFNFPYYYNDDDLFKVGVLMRELKIASTYEQDNVSLESVEFHGNILPIDILQPFLNSTLLDKPNPECEVILQRVPLEIGYDIMGFAYVYERFTTVIKDEKEEK